MVCTHRKAGEALSEALPHNIPDWHNSQAGPFDLWPTGLGFEYFYGFIGGDTSQWAPAIFENIKPIEPPHDDKNYFFERDMADKAIERIRLLHSIAPDKPWVTYLGSLHDLFKTAR